MYRLRKFGLALRSFSEGGLSTGIESLIGIAASACPICGSTILSAIGIAGGLTAFPFGGLELKAISLKNRLGRFFCCLWIIGMHRWTLRVIPYAKERLINLYVSRICQNALFSLFSHSYFFSHFLAYGSEWPRTTLRPLLSLVSMQQTLLGVGRKSCGRLMILLTRALPMARVLEITLFSLTGGATPGVM